MNPVRLHLPPGVSSRFIPVATVHRTLGTALSDYVMAGEEGDAARALLSCLEGGSLDLRALPEEYAHLPHVMEVRAWAALREAVDALDLGPVTEVHAGAADDAYEFNLLAVGLEHLPALREVHLVVPREGCDLRLTRLRQQPPPTVHLDCPRAAGLRLTTCQGVGLEAFGEALDREVFLDRPEHITVDRQGRELAREPLPGVQFFAPLPPEAVLPGSNPLEVQAVLVETDLNLRRHFPDSPEARDLGVVDTPQACRHFALAYAWAQQAYEREQAELPPARRTLFRFLPEDPGGRLNVADPPARTERAYREMLATQALALTSNAGFGCAIADLCDTLAPAEARVYLVRAFNHMMAVKLVRAPGPTSLFLVSFYDPTRTLTDQGLWVRATADLERLSLSDFLAEWDLEGAGWNPEIAVIYAVPTDPAAPAAPRDAKHAGPSATGPLPLALHGPFLLEEPAADWLSFLVPANAIAPVMQAIASVPEPGSPEGLAVLRAAADDGYPALHVACVRGADDGVAAYVAAVLAIPPERLPEAARVKLLQGVVGDDVEFPALYHAFAHGNRSVALFTRHVLGAPPQVLGEAAKRTLVAAADDVSAARPVTEAIARSAARGLAARERVDDSVLAWAHEVLATATLTPAVRQALVVTAGEAAAQAMAPPPRDAKHERPDLVAHPGPAAALLCAVMESRLPEDERTLLVEASGLDPRAVLEALAARGEGQDTRWIARLLEALPASGLPGAEVRALRRAYPAVRRGFPPLADRAGVQALLKAPAGLAVSGLPVTPAQWAQAGLRALALDANPDWVLCAARQPLPELAPFRLASGMRRGVAIEGGEGEGLRYLLPAGRLLALASTSTAKPGGKASGPPPEGPGAGPVRETKSSS